MHMASEIGRPPLCKLNICCITLRLRMNFFVYPIHFFLQANLAAYHIQIQKQQQQQIKKK